MAAADDEYAIGIRAITELPVEVEEELQLINEATQPVTETNENVVSMDGYSLDANRYILVGPLATQHLMDILHNTAAGHMGSRKLLAKFTERYTYGRHCQISQALTCACEGCQQGTAYWPTRPPLGKIVTERL